MHRLLLSILVSASLLAGGAIAQSRPPDDGFKPEIEGAQARRDTLVGNWYGEVTQANGQTRRWLSRRSADGTFVLEAAFDDPAMEPPPREYGVWGVSGPVYFTITQGWILADGRIHPSDPRDANLYDAYTILRLSEDRFEYRGLETGNRFTVRRVADDVRL